MQSSMLLSPKMTTIPPTVEKSPMAPQPQQRSAQRVFYSPIESSRKRAKHHTETAYRAAAQHETPQEPWFQPEPRNIAIRWWLAPLGLISWALAAICYSMCCIEDIQTRYIASGFAIGFAVLGGALLAPSLRYIAVRWLQRHRSTPRQQR